MQCWCLCMSLGSSILAQLQRAHSTAATQHPKVPQSAAARGTPAACVMLQYQVDLRPTDGLDPLAEEAEPELDAAIGRSLLYGVQRKPAETQSNSAAVMHAGRVQGKRRNRATHSKT